MAAPRRLTFSVLETAARWSCAPADILDWAIMGLVELCCIVPFAMTTGGEVSGLVAIPAEEVMHMFRRDGLGAREAIVRRMRFRNTSGPWYRLQDEQCGIRVGMFDIMIAAEAIDAFEAEHDVGPRPRHFAGGAPKWDWDGFYSALIARIYRQGLPEQQKDLVEEMLGWFERRSEDGEAPDISTIRKRVSVIWRDLQRE